MILPGFGRAAQEALAGSHALVVGCGALGCAAIDLLARAGVGTLTLVDRDTVEATNLQRQTLYTERDVRESAPKAEAAKRRVREVNSTIRVHACVEHLGPENALEMVRDSTVVVDGLDNYRTRFVLNDAAVQLGRPYIYAGAVGMRGMSMPMLAGADQLGADPAKRADPANRADRAAAPARMPCLRCLFGDAPPPGEGETCDTAGVFAPVVAATGALAASQALKVMAGLWHLVDRSLWSLDLHANREHRTPLAGAARPDCPCCAHRTFAYLQPNADDQVTILCGRNAVQVTPARHGPAAALDLHQLAARLQPLGRFEVRDRLLTGALGAQRTPEGGPVELTLFADGRAIVRGSTDRHFAKSLYDRLVGS